MREGTLNVNPMSARWGGRQEKLWERIKRSRALLFNTSSRRYPMDIFKKG